MLIIFMVGDERNVFVSLGKWLYNLKLFSRVKKFIFVEGSISKIN